MPCRRPRCSLPTVAMTAIGSETLLQKGAASPASPPPKAEKPCCPMTRRSTNCATRSRSCLQGSKIGDASRPAMIDAHTPSSRRSASQLHSPSTSINEFLSLELFKRLRSTDGVHVYEGDVRKRRHKGGLEQKMVDVMLAVDMLTHSF